MLFWPTTRQDSKVRFTVRPAAIGVCCKVTRHSRLVTLLQDYPASLAVYRAASAVGQGQRRECALARAAKCDQRTFEPFSPRTGSHIAGTQIGKSNCFGIGWGFGLLVGWTLCSYDTQLAPHQRDTLVGQHHSLFSPVSRSYCQARAHAAWAGKASVLHVVLVDRSWRNGPEAHPGIRSLPRCREVQSAHVRGCCLKALGKNEKWRHFGAHAQWWSPWRRKNVEKGHLAPSNLTYLLVAIDRNGFRRMKE